MSWPQDDLGLWQAINTNLGSGFLYFVLDVLVVVVTIPLVLGWRDRRTWRPTRALVARFCRHRIEDIAIDWVILAEALLKYKEGDRSSESYEKFVHEVERARDHQNSAKQEFERALGILAASIDAKMASPLAKFVQSEIYANGELERWLDEGFRNLITLTKSSSGSKEIKQRIEHSLKYTQFRMVTVMMTLGSLVKDFVQLEKVTTVIGKIKPGTPKVGHLYEWIDR